MAVTFKYGILPEHYSKEKKKPVIKLTFKGSNQTILDVIALLDSGADVSVIPKGLAEVLGLDFREKRTSKGIGGEIDVWNSSVNISMKGEHEPYKFLLPIQIANNDDIPPIIGREGFFNKFKIMIDEDNQKITLKRNSNK